MDSEVRNTETGEAVPPLYTARTVLNAQTQQEASQALAPKYTKFVSYSALAICVVILGVLIWQYLETKSQQNLLLSAVLVLLIGYMVYSHLTMPKRLIRRWEEGMRQNYGTAELHLTTEFFTFNLAQTLEENQDIVVESYSDLSGLRETEHLFLLRRNASTWFFVAKSGLEGCTEEEFRSFISGRMGG